MSPTSYQLLHPAMRFHFGLMMGHKSQRLTDDKCSVSSSIYNTKQIVLFSCVYRILTTSLILKREDFSFVADYTYVEYNTRYRYFHVFTATLYSLEKLKSIYNFHLYSSHAFLSIRFHLPTIPVYILSQA